MVVNDYDVSSAGSGISLLSDLISVDTVGNEPLYVAIRMPYRYWLS